MTDHQSTHAIELLPLPRPSFDYPYAYDGDDMENYALANVGRATARLQAEVEALRAEVEMLCTDPRG